MALRCFVSHPWASNLHYFALTLAEALRQRGVATWIDEQEMLPGLGISTRQKNGIVNETNVFLLVLASATLESPNCMEELRCALQHGKRVIALQVGICEIPAPLSDKISVDFLNPVLFDAAVDRLMEGLLEYDRLDAIVAKLVAGDPDERAEAINILTQWSDASAFSEVKRRMALERDDTVSQWFPRYLLHVARLDPTLELEVMRLLTSLEAGGGPLTLRAGRLARQEHAEFLSESEGGGQCARNFGSGSPACLPAS